MANGSTLDCIEGLLPDKGTFDQWIALPESRVSARANAWWEQNLHDVIRALDDRDHIVIAVGMRSGRYFSSDAVDDQEFEPHNLIKLAKNWDEMIHFFTGLHDRGDPDRDLPEWGDTRMVYMDTDRDPLGLYNLHRSRA